MYALLHYFVKTRNSFLLVHYIKGILVLQAIFRKIYAFFGMNL